jgi:protocatechuate 4,5-dioxygenase beta chain
MAERLEQPMLGLGIATSHAPAVFCPPEVWPKVYDAIPDYMKGAQPASARGETPEVVKEQVARIERAFAVLREEIAAYRPDAIVYVGDDQGDMFNESNIPTLAVFTGAEVWGATKPRYMPQPLEASHLTVPVHVDLAERVLKGLVHRGFDPAIMRKMQPLGNPRQGMSHMLIHPHPRIVPDNDIPVVPIFLNENFPPLPTGRRCWELGLALREILAEAPECVAIYGSGGLSHDPRGPRAGWIDEPLDHWVLERIERGEGEQLTNLFTFDSDTLRGGTAEIRAWIVAAGAMGRPGKLIDYFPSHHAKCGLGFVYWPHRGAARARAAE